MSIGENLKKIRKNKGITQEKLSNITQISITSIQRYELGKRQPTIEIAKKIADALGVSFAELTKEEVKEDKNKPFAPGTLYKGKEYTKELRTQLMFLHAKKNRYNDIDDILNNVPAEVKEYIDMLKEILEKTEDYYMQINHEHTIEKNYYMEIINEIREISSNISYIDSENE